MDAKGSEPLEEEREKIESEVRAWKRRDVIEIYANELNVTY